jgi:arylsulfatase A-like enzyme
VDAAAVVTAWAAMLLAENVAVGVLWSQQFSAAWEVSQARRLVAPMALAGLAPASLLAVGVWRLAARAQAGARLATRAIAVLGGGAALGISLGVSQGRHFASWVVRGPFVAVSAMAGALVAAWAAPRVAALAKRPVVLAALGVALAVTGWLTDAYVLPRLYPAFHWASLVVALGGAALVGLAARASSGPPTRAARGLTVAVAVVVLASIAWTPHAAQLLESLTNLRIVLVEHAPLLGRTVALATRLRPAPDDGTAAAPPPIAPGEVARSLDWTGHDLVLVTVDALRADHASAYGYVRRTTPNLDALAAEGTLFESAYCPTPHTSYSVTSMMTGKYLRPLLELGLGQDSETWAQDLRRYGWRTAAFYPPAVFFIDEDRFPRFEEDKLGFEYAKVEFAGPELREQQVAAYLDGAPAGVPLFLWVHFFEPHEPYVLHPQHVFTGGPSPDVDAYDGEVAEADDGVGRVVRLVRARRPGAVVVVTADHGEEFGEHGGRYHGTTVYEEQVRVPLVVAGAGVRRAARVATVVQSIDLLPTALSALGIPRPARLRGRDLGPLLAGDARALDEGFAFAETDDYALVAADGDRLVCERRVAACALYRPGEDPGERRDRARDEPARFEHLRALLRAVERDHGRYEEAGGPTWPEALRRGIQGEAEAAPDVASLLDDADPVIRRKAAAVCFALRAPQTVPALRRALARDEDDEVRRWSALALARLGEPLQPPAEAMLRDPSRDWRRQAALALGERGDPRACEELAAWWSDVMPAAGQGGADGEPLRLAIDLAHAQELLGATAKARCRTAVPALVHALDDVRARPYVADALGALADDRARAPLLALLATEPYVTTRPHEARALLALGARDWAAPATPTAAPAVQVALAVPRGAQKLVVLLSDGASALDVSADGAALPPAPGDGAGGAGGAGETVRWIELPARAAGGGAALGKVHLDLRLSAGTVLALWLVPTGRLD